jgi:hypothetical protein
MAVRILTLLCSGARLTLSEQLVSSPSMVFTNARMAFWTLWFSERISGERVDEKPKRKRKVARGGSAVWR